MGSADWMPRNLDRRVEITFPVEDPELKKQVVHILEVELEDNVKAHVLQPDGSYEKEDKRGKVLVNSQEQFCQEAVRMAVDYGAGVEAELGSMGRRESGAGDGSGAEDETKIYTDPEQARDFVEQTGIDALACSFGTTHGIYLKQPKLDFDVVRRVRELTGNIPVVMHGGSGVSSEDFHRAIEAGVRKINYFTYMDKAGGNATAQYLGSLKEGEPIFFSSVIEAAREGMKENVKAAMKVFAKME